MNHFATPPPLLHCREERYGGSVLYQGRAGMHWKGGYAPPPGRPDYAQPLSP